MIKIVSYTKYENEYFFFVENKEKALSASETNVLVENGFTNLSRDYFDSIVSK